jgi:small-conductance mechanosensitive channel
VLNGLAAGALEFNVRAWTIDKADWVTVRSALAVRLRDGLAEAGIVVPTPRWTLEMQPHTAPAVVAATENQERAGLAARPAEDRQAK